MTRRVLLFVVVVAIVIAARVFFVRPVDVELELDYGRSAAAIRQASLVFTDANDRIARELSMPYPAGAPMRETRHMRLKPGDYQVGVRLALDGAPDRTLGRPLHVGDAGHYVLDLSP
jgi:hypothetical protein